MSLAHLVLLLSTKGRVPLESRHVCVKRAAVAVTVLAAMACRFVLVAVVFVGARVVTCFSKLAVVLGDIIQIKCGASEGVGLASGVFRGSWASAV